MTIRVRPSSEADVPAITNIYAHHVRHGRGTFEENPPDEAEMARRRDEVLTTHDLPYLVAENAGGRVVGYAYAAPHRLRSAYRFTIEDSIYVEAEAMGQGIGKALLAALIEECQDRAYRQMIAVIGDSENLGSIQLHAALGFERVGLLPSIGFKFATWVDVVLMQRALGPGERQRPPADELA